MCCFCPTGRRDGDEVVAKVDKDIDEVPTVECELRGIISAMQKAIVPIPTL